MSKYITWRQLHGLSLRQARTLSEAGEIWLTADGNTVGELVMLRRQNDNQSTVASVGKQVISDVASNQHDNQRQVQGVDIQDAKEAILRVASVPVDNQGREPIKPGSLELYRPGYHKTGDHVLMRQGKRLVEAIVPPLDADGQIIPGE